MQARALLIILVGVPVCAGILTSFPLFFVMSLHEGQPLTRGDLIQGSIFCFGAIVVVGMSVTAFMRVRNTGDSVLGRFPLVIPVLVLIGVAGGGKLAWEISEGRKAANERHDAELCTEPTFWGVDQPTCLSRSKACRAAAFRTTPPRKGDPAYEKLTAALLTIRSRLDQESMARARQTGFGYEPPRFYDGLLATLSSSYEFAVYDRATMLCLFDARK